MCAALRLLGFSTIPGGPLLEKLALKGRAVHQITMPMQNGAHKVLGVGWQTGPWHRAAAHRGAGQRELWHKQSGGTELASTASVDKRVNAGIA